MAGRSPVVAGQFYPADTVECRDQVNGYLASAAAAGFEASSLVAGIMPHAGWMCSGAVAAQVAAATGKVAVETFVIFGAAHRAMQARAAIWRSGLWETPIGNVPIDEDLAEAVLNASPLVTDDESAHLHEHSIEVEVPFLHAVHPHAYLLPVLVMPSGQASQIGRVVAEQALALGRKVVFLGSTDLTHYGPRYGFTPQGIGPEALDWAKRVNDRRMINLCLRLGSDEVVEEAARHHNACGSGAVAATLSAARHLGVSEGMLCSHTTSAEVLRDRYGEMDDAVGYAAMVFNSAAV